MEETTILIELDAPPQAKQSTRIGKKRAYTCPKKRAYQRELMCKIREQYKKEKLSRFAMVRIEFGFKQPKRLTKSNSFERNCTMYKTTSPDADNLAKPVLDAMTQAGVMEDDNVVTCLSITKIWSYTNYILITIAGV